MPDGDLPSEVVRAGREPHSRRGPKISEILRSLTDDTSRERISVGDLLVAMGDRAFGPLMLFFALPNILPMPPGASGIFGLPLTILATQFMLGRKPWLPRIVAKRSLSRADLILILNRAEKWVTRLEKLLKPRLTILVAPPAERVIGAHCLILAIILALPIPFGNVLPAFAICLFCLGVLERDGAWVIAGFLAFVATITVVAGVLFALLKGAVLVINAAFN